MNRILLLTSLLLGAVLSLGTVYRTVAAAPVVRTGQDYALLFAVNDYTNMDKLQNPIANAQEIAQALKQNYGFAVEVVTNPTLDQIDAKLAEYERKFTNGTFDQKGQLFVFFSGHGLYERGNGYFMTKHANPAAPQRTAMEYDYYRGLIDEIPCQHIMVAIDACHSAAFDPSFSTRTDRRFGRPGEREIDRVIANHDNYQSRVFWTSDGVGDQTPDRSQFAYKFLEGLRAARTNTGYITSSVLYSQYLEQAAPKPGGGRFGSDDPSSCFLFFKTDFNSDFDPEEEQLWQFVNQQGTKEGYEFYLQRYPSGKHNEEAKQKAVSFVDNNGSPIPPTTTVSDNLVHIPGGTFEMGDTFGDGQDNERPVHSVTVSSFYLAKTELTIAEFEQFVLDTGYKTYADGRERNLIFRNGLKAKAGVNWRNDSKGKVIPRSDYNHPVVFVSWDDAIAYCNWLSQERGLAQVYVKNNDSLIVNWQANGYRLPTEAEWEYAARSGGQLKKWSGTNDYEKLTFFANISNTEDVFLRTAPVGSFLANQIGLFDMCGNVLEWCWDWYDDSYYSDSAELNPKGPNTGTYHVTRGGSWLTIPKHCRSTYRTEDVYNACFTGFRLARSF